MKPMGRLAHDWGWENTFVSRVTRMVHRDRNFPSIIFWSLGNEAGRGRNFWKARKLVQELDPSRPVLYESGGALAEGTGRTELTDVISTMYPDVPRTLRLATRQDEDRPVILCEYSHAMGNSNGNLHYYWKAFWDKDLPRLRGGCIWDMIDQGLRLPDTKNGDGFYFGYGGDFGDTCNDLQFCINVSLAEAPCVMGCLVLSHLLVLLEQGMFSPDRDPHPAVTEIKFLQQPVVFTPGTDSNAEGLHVVVEGDRAASVVLHATNRYTFRDLSHLAWSWQLTSNRSAEPVRSGHFELPNRHSIQDIVLILDAAVPSVRKLHESGAAKGDKYFLNIRGFLVSDTSWAFAGHILVRQQFKLSFDFEESIPRPPIDSTQSEAHTRRKLETHSDDQEVRVSFQGDASPFVVLDKSTGSIVSYSPQGHNLFAGDTRANFTRAATDNDKGGMELALDFIFPFKVDRLFALFHGTEEFSYYSHWRRVGLDASSPPRAICSRMKITEDHGEKVDVVALCSILSSRNGTELFKITIHYTIFSDGRVRVSHHVIPQPILKKTSSLPRVGMNLQLDPSLSQIQYFGRGPEENYPDRKAGSEMGVYATTPSDMGYFNYIVPGENGSRSDCEWIAFRRKEGDGVCILSKEDENSDSNFSCSALLYSTSELEAATHTCDLERRESGPIHVNIDHKLMGLGGDNR
jgi:beta-galactosidase